MKRKNFILIGIVLIVGLGFSSLNAHSCANKHFSVTIKKRLSIGDVVDNIAEMCGLSVIVKDALGQKRLNKKLFYIRLQKATLSTFLNIVLTDNDLSYKLVGDKLIIRYLTTKTFTINYIAGDRRGTSSANINIASTGKTNINSASSSSGIIISSNDNFNFWKKLEKEIHRILVASGDGSMYFKKTKDGWLDRGGNIWEFNPTKPIVDPEAGLITVTGTPTQIQRVSKYLSKMANQVKRQVLIDVKILSVTLNHNKQTGIDWNRLYSLQDFTISTFAVGKKNISEWSTQNGKIIDAKLGADNGISSGVIFELSGSKNINNIIRFLKTQGRVKTVSNPKVMTLNNQPALISVGKELFYKIKNTSISKDSSAERTTKESIDSVFAGILLDITPEIDKDGMITLKINPSITETDGPIDASGGRSMPPDLIRRQLSTVIKVRNGKHAILGGLISRVESTVDSSVPLISKIPILGEAFKRVRKVKKTEELVIIITPKITSGSGGLPLKKLGYRSIIK